MKNGFDRGGNSGERLALIVALLRNNLASKVRSAQQVHRNLLARCDLRLQAANHFFPSRQGIHDELFIIRA
jgi:hypothetical protein